METEFAVSLGSQRWTLPADSDTFTIGRGSNADIRLPSDDQISRIHARLNRSGTTWTLVDESRNGTALNGRRLAAPTALTDSDRIQIGRSVLTFHEQTAATPPPAPSPNQPRPPAAPPGSPAPAPAPPSSRPAGAPPDPANATGAASAAGLAAGTASAAGLAAGGGPSSAPRQADGSAPNPADAAGAAGPAAGGASSAPPAPSRADHFTPNPADSAGGASGPGPAAGGTSSAPPTSPAQRRADDPNGADAAGAASGAGLAAGGPSSAPPPSPAPRRTDPADAGAPGRGAGSSSAPSAPGRADRPGPSPADTGAPSGAGFAPGSSSLTPRPAQSPPTASPAQAGAAGTPGTPSTPSTPAQAGPIGPEGGHAERADTPDIGGGARSPEGARGEWVVPEGVREEWLGVPEGAREEWIGVPEGGRAEWDGGPDAGQPAEGPDDARGEWVGGARVGWVDEDGGSAGGAAWAAYPSADNPEPARSPWSTPKRPALTQPEGGQANWAESAGWPDSAFEQQEQQSPPAREPEPVRRKPPTTEPAQPGYVRLVRVLLVAGAVLGLGLLINLVATFFADGAGGTLRWLVPPAIALIAAMVVALIDAVSSEDRPAGGRLDVPVIVAIVTVLLGVGVGGFALTAGVEYAAGYITGKESGEDRLIKPVAKTTAGLTVTVENVTYTSHFTRVEVAVSNGGDQSLSLPLEGHAFTGEDGNSLKADGFRSQWQDSIAAGSVERGTITFKGHLPEGLTVATLTLKSGDAPIAVPGLALSN